MAKFQPPYDWLDLILREQRANHAQVMKEIKKMAADLSALQNAVTKLKGDVDTVVAAYLAAKANEVDPAVAAQMVTDLTEASNKIAGALPPAA